jgi:hypothetical protein
MQAAQRPWSCNSYRATNAAQRHPFNQYMFEVLLEALDELAPAVVAIIILFAVINMTIFLYLGG